MVLSIISEIILNLRKYFSSFSSTYIHLLFFTQSTYIHYTNTLIYYFGPPPESQTLNCLKIDNIAERQQFFLKQSLN